MSNNVLNDSYFGNKDIPACEKLGAIALLYGGTYNEETSQDGKNQIFVSTVYKKGTQPTSIMFTHGNAQSLAPLACYAGLNAMGVLKGQEPSTIFSGAMSDEEIVNAISQQYKIEMGLSEQGLEGRGVSIQDKLNRYFETCRKTKTPISMEVQNKFLDTCTLAYGGKKKEKV